MELTSCIRCLLKETQTRQFIPEQSNNNGRVHFFESEGKRDSSVWTTPNTPPPKKAWVTKSIDKVMLFVLIDKRGVLLFHSLELGQTVNAAYYSRGDVNDDNKIFTMATLLSSTLIYNVFGAFNQDALDKIRFITEIAKNVKVKDGDSASDDSDFDVYFPEFILAMRDFSLGLEIDGREISPDDYLEHCLEAQSGTGEEVEKFNEQRLCIRKYFKRRKCFTFDRPTGSGKLLLKLEQLTDDDLIVDFKEDTRTFLQYVFNHCQGLKLNNGQPVNGRMFVLLAENYVNKVREGAVPCIMSALQAMVVVENERAIQRALDLYKTKMEEKLIFPTKNDKVLWKCHMKSKDEAFVLFLGEKLMDDDNKYKDELDEKVNQLFQDFENKNNEESLNRCKEAINSLRQVISNKLSDGVYAQPGGYDTYKQDKDDMRRQYNAISGLGVMKKKAYLGYLYATTAEEEAVMISDKQLTEQQREIENEKMERENAERLEAEAREMLDYELEQMKDMEEQLKTEVDTLSQAYSEALKKERENREALIEKRTNEIIRLQQENLKEIREQHEKDLEKLKQEQDIRDKQHEENITKMQKKMDEQMAQMAQNHHRHHHRPHGLKKRIKKLGF